MKDEQIRVRIQSILYFCNNKGIISGFIFLSRYKKDELKKFWYLEASRLVWVLRALSRMGLMSVVFRPEK